MEPLEGMNEQRKINKKQKRKEVQMKEKRNGNEKKERGTDQAGKVRKRTGGRASRGCADESADRFEGWISPVEMTFLIPSPPAEDG